MRRCPLAILLLSVTAALLPAPASAARARADLSYVKPMKLGGRPMTVAHKGVKVRLVTRSPARSVVIRAFRGSKRIYVERKKLERRGGRGIATAVIGSARGGRVTVKGAGAKPLRYRVYEDQAYPGEAGPKVYILQRGLQQLGYPVGRTGYYGAQTQRAVKTFNRANRMGQGTVASEAVFAKVARKRGAVRARFPGHGRHVEADLGRQILTLFEGAKPVATYYTSSGKPSTPTVLGTYRFYWKQPGRNDKGMVHSSYFIGGYAIHGYPSVPDYPASHGCLRIPIPDARAVFNWIRNGEIIDVYYGGAGVSSVAPGGNPPLPPKSRQPPPPDRRG